MTINKWNDLLKDYEQVEVSDSWNIKIYSPNMDEKINCVCCGKKICFGEGYTSRRYHSNRGFGYSECKTCYEAYNINLKMAAGLKRTD